MNPIVQDLGGDDLTAINVALVLKGVRPNLDTNPRFGGFSDYWKSYIKFDFIKYSLILDKVTAKATEFTYVPETKTFTSKEINTKTFSLEDWLKLAKTPDQFIDSIKLAKAPRREKA